jgi:hypothetical protein
MALSRYRFLLCIAVCCSLLAAARAEAQTFGTPEAEKNRLAQMSDDIEKIKKVTDYLSALAKKKVIDLAPTTTTPRSVLEKWREEDAALKTYIELFSDLHGASVVLINVISLSLRVGERFLPPFIATNVCMYMPGKSGLLTSQKTQGDRSVLKHWSSLGVKTLSSSEMVRVTEGLEAAERLADAYNLLCDRARNPDNWK